MEAIPLGKVRLGVPLVVLVPLEHFRAEVDVGTAAVLADSVLGVVEHVVGVNDSELLAVDEAAVDEEVKEADKLGVTGLAAHEVVEARDVAQGRDGAPPVGGDGAARVADKKGEVEVSEDGEGQVGRVAGLNASAQRRGDPGPLPIRGMR